MHDDGGVRRPERMVMRREGGGGGCGKGWWSFQFVYLKRVWWVDN